MQLGHLLIRSGLTYPEVSSKVYYDSFCQLGSSGSLTWVIYFEAFYLHYVSSFSCIPVFCPKLLLFLTPLQFVYLFCNLSQVYPAVLLMYFIYNPLKPSSYYMHQQFNIQKLYFLLTLLYLCALYGSQNKQRLFPYTTLTDWFL